MRLCLKMESVVNFCYIKNVVLKFMKQKKIPLTNILRIRRKLKYKHQ